MVDRQSVIVTQGIHHVSINVKDVSAALDFYVGVLNLELKKRPDLGFPGAWIQAGEQEIHLLGIDSGVPVKEQHFAFAVTDADTVHEALADAVAAVRLGHAQGADDDVPRLVLKRHPQ